LGELVVAIDIGTTKVCALCGRLNKAGQLEALGRSVVPCAGMRKGQIADMDAVTGALVEALTQVEAAAGVKIESAYISLMGMNADVIANRYAVPISGAGREVRREDVDALNYGVRNVHIPSDSQLIDVIPRQYIIDGYGRIADPVGMVGNRIELEADIVTGKFAAISNIAKCVEAAGLKIDGLVISGEALGEAILSPEEMDMGVILIDVGGTVTDVSVFKNGRLSFYDSIPVGGDHISNDISIAMRIPFAEAEKIKREYELALTSLITKDQEVAISDISEVARKRVYISEIVEVIEARVAEIMGMCRELLSGQAVSLEYGAGVVLTGSGIAYFDGNKQIANEIFGLPVRVYPARVYSNQNMDSTLPEGMVRYVTHTYRGTRYGSLVQFVRGRERGSGGGAFARIVAALKRIF